MAHIILNNGMLDFVNIEQQEAGLVPFGTELVNPDFSRVAEAMGAKGIRVEEPGDVRDALQAALAHTPAAAAKGFTLSLAKRVLSGKMDDVIETIEHNLRLV